MERGKYGSNTSNKIKDNGFDYSTDQKKNNSDSVSNVSKGRGKWDKNTVNNKYGKNTTGNKSGKFASSDKSNKDGIGNNVRMSNEELKRMERQYELDAINRPKDKISEDKEGRFNYMSHQNEMDLDRKRKAVRSKFMESEDSAHRKEDEHKNGHFFGFGNYERTNGGLYGAGSSYGGRSRKHFQHLGKNSHGKKLMGENPRMSNKIAKSYGDGFFGNNEHREEISDDCNCHYLPVDHIDPYYVDSEGGY